MVVNYGSGHIPASSDLPKVSLKKGRKLPLTVAAICTAGLLLVALSYYTLQGPAVLEQGFESDELLVKAAQLEEQQKAKVAAAAQKLANEEQQEEVIEEKAAELRKEAAMKADQAESKFEAIKRSIIAQAATEIAQAEAAKDIAEQGSAKHQQLGANGDKFLDMNAPSQTQHDNFADLDPPGTPPKPGGGSAAFRPARRGGRPTQHLVASESAVETDDQIAELETELTKAKAAAAVAQRRIEQHLAGAFPGSDASAAGASSDDTPGPMFHEDYKKGDLGPLAVSKWVTEDHPPTHPNCTLEDIDCDELWPWGKAPADFTGPPKRDGPLGDNLIGIFGQDDVVVPSEDSGLIGKAEPAVDKFDHWPEESKKNKDLLYGLARKALSQKYTGAGDIFVPLDTAKKLNSGELTLENGAKLGAGNGLADMLFGSWHMGFNKPHNHVVSKDVNMFDQPYRQHMSVVDGNGQQVFNGPSVDLGLTPGDDAEDSSSGAAAPAPA